MPRAYRQRTRATAVETTRQRILDAALQSVSAGEFGVREIAERASVTVQTVYAHFNSKSGLIAAVVQEASIREGLVSGLERVWKLDAPDAALAEMVSVTFGFFHRAWPLMRFTLAARRSDPDFAALVRAVDDSRHADLLTICERLASRRELRAGLGAASAASLVFAMTSPYAYEDLVASGRLSFRAALRVVTLAVRSAVLAKRA